MTPNPDHLTRVALQVHSLEQTMQRRFDHLEQRLDATMSANQPHMPRAGALNSRTAPTFVVPQPPPPTQSAPRASSVQPANTAPWPGTPGQAVYGPPRTDPQRPPQPTPTNSQTPDRTYPRPATRTSRPGPQTNHRPSNRRPRTAPTSSMAQPQHPTPQLNAQTAAPTSKPSGSLSSTARFAVTVENIMKWSGLALVSFAVLFLVSTAISRGWIRPELQLTAATLIGFSLYGFAWRLREKNHQWTQALNHAGAIVTVVCAAAAHEWLNLVSLQTSLGLVAIAAASAVAVCVRLRTPLAIATTTVSTLVAVLFMNIAVELSVAAAALSMGALSVVSTSLGLLPTAKKLPSSIQDDTTRVAQNFVDRWRTQRLISSTAAALAFLAMNVHYVFFSPTKDVGVARGIALVFMGIMAACLWLGPVSEDWLGRSIRSKASSSDSFRNRSPFEHRLLIAVPVWTWMCTTLLLLTDSPSTTGGFGLVLAFAFGLLAMLTRRSLPESLYVSHLLGASILGSISIFALVDGPVTIVALAAQAVGCAILGRRLNDPLLRWNGLALAAAAWVGICLSVVRIEGLQDSWPTVLASLAVTSAVVGVAHITRENLSQIGREVINGLGWALLVLTTWMVGINYLEGIEVLLILTVATMATAAVQPLLGRAVGLLGAALGGLAMLATVTTFPLALVDGASLLGHGANLSTAALAIAVAAALAGRKHKLAAASISAAWIVSMLWLATALVHLPQGQLLLSAAWALAAAMAILAGVVQTDRTFQVLGMSTLAVVLIKLFSVDLSTIDTFWRAGLFFVVGVGFLQLGYRLPQISARLASDGTTASKADGPTPMAGSERTL